MPDVASIPPILRFGVFEVDLRAGELRKKGVKVRLQEQPLQLLAALLEQPGQLVTRDELRQRLWAGTTVDFDHSINTNINKLREALGDSADSPRFIETLPRRGYRFIYPVNGASGADTLPPPPPADEIPNLPDPRVFWRRHWATALVATSLAVVAILALHPGGARDKLVGRAGATGVTSIAVLPLKNLSADPQQDYFVDGTTEALITELGRIGSLRVLSYQTMLGYRQTTKPLPELARELKVDAVLEGAVLHSGAKVRIAANLVQAAPERHLWADSYEFNVRDVVAVQGEVARGIARSIRANVTPGEQERLRASRPVDSEAYQAYLLARAHMSKPPTQESWFRAKLYLETAIDKDPGYAPAYAALAELYGRRQPRTGAVTRNPTETRAQVRKWCEKALELDDTLAEPHTILARLAQQDWDWPRAEREYRRAIELNPNYASARIQHAMYLYAMQRFEEAVAEGSRAQQLDPTSPLVNTWAGAAYFFVGRVEEAMASWQRALELDPEFPDASIALARAYLTQGRHQLAIAELQKAMPVYQKQPMLLGALAHAYAQAGQREEALKLVGELNRIEAEKSGYVSPFGLVWAYAGLGDRDQAFAWLERAVQERFDRMVWLNVDPLMAPLRSDPRFKDLARRMGLPAPDAARP